MGIHQLGFFKIGAQTKQEPKHAAFNPIYSNRPEKLAVGLSWPLVRIDSLCLFFFFMNQKRHFFN